MKNKFVFALFCYILSSISYASDTEIFMFPNIKFGDSIEKVRKNVCELDSLNGSLPSSSEKYSILNRDIDKIYLICDVPKSSTFVYSVPNGFLSASVMAKFDITGLYSLELFSGSRSDVDNRNDGFYKFVGKIKAYLENKYSEPEITELGDGFREYSYNKGTIVLTVSNDSYIINFHPTGLVYEKTDKK